MRGAGTKKDITTSNPPARLLDLTRLLSRAGHGPMTGVDRVESAYLSRLLAGNTPFFALVRLAGGFALLDKTGIKALRDLLTGAAPFGPVDVVGRLSRKLSQVRRRAESDARRLAIATCFRRGLAKMLQRHIPPGTAYLNVGHSNLSTPVMAALKTVPDLTIAVLVHDMIPLDFPQHQRLGTPAIFEARMRAVSASADLVICNSEQTRSDAQRYFEDWGRVPDMIVAHLGVEMPDQPGGKIPANVDQNRPWFVTIGTIEPRKCTNLLLDIWSELARGANGADIPLLLIIGQRGWANEEVFARLDNDPIMGRHVQELNAVNDADLVALLKGSRGLLFPSVAEGFGLPPLEAAALGVPVVCGNLAVYREFLADFPTYIDSGDSFSWLETIKLLTTGPKTGHGPAEAGKNGVRLPTWDVHFNLVLKVT